MRERIRNYLRELPGALALAFLTAAVTLILAIVLSVVLGSGNEYHRDAQRCAAALFHDMLIEAHDLDLAKYPRINVAGLDCSIIFETTPTP